MFEVQGFGYGVSLFVVLGVQGFAVRVFGCVVSSFGNLGFGYGVSRFGVGGTGFRGAGFLVRGFGYGVSRFGVSGSGFRVLGSRLGFSG